MWRRNQLEPVRQEKLNNDEYQLPLRAGDPQKKIQQPRIPAQRTQQPFRGAFPDLLHMLVTNRPYKFLAQDSAGRPQRDPVKREPGSFSSLPHRSHGMNTQSQVSVGNVMSVSAMSAHTASGNWWDHDTTRYVDRQREAEGVHGKTWTGEIQSSGESSRVDCGSQIPKINDRISDDHSDRRRPNFTREIFASEPQLQARSPLNGSTQPELEHQKSIKKQRNWPCFPKISSGQMTDNNAGPRWTCKLQRRNAQRRARRYWGSPDAPDEEQDKIESDANRPKGRFYRRMSPRDVHVYYPSPTALARRKGTMPQILEVAVEETDSDDYTGISASPCPDEEQRVDLGGENLFKEHHREVDTGACKTEENPQRLCPTPDVHDAPVSSKRDTLLENSHNNTHNGNGHAHPKPRRFPLVVGAVRQRRPLPSLPTPPLSTASTKVSTPAPGPESYPFAQDSSHCGTPGCTWPDCLRIRGTFRMMDPGAADEKSEGGSGSGEAKDEADIVSPGDGFAFLRLN